MEIVKIAEANRAVDTIVRVLHEGTADRRDGALIISEVVKGGSLGHGTAVKGNYDLDLVVYSDSKWSLTGELVLEKGLEYWLTCLQKFLDSKLPGRIENRHRTFASLQFTFDRYIDCDVLLSPLWREPHQFYQFLQSIQFKDRMRFSVGASRWQVAFFKKQPNEVKELIKRAKAWRNQKWSGDPSGKPKSYFLSVLVLRAYETATQRLGRNAPFSQISRETTTVLVTMVTNHNNVDIYWEEYYTKEKYPKLFIKDPPRIVDPANPSNNLYHSGIAAPTNKKAQDHGDGGGKWDRMASLIHTLDLTNSID